MSLLDRVRQQLGRVSLRRFPLSAVTIEAHADDTGVTVRCSADVSEREAGTAMTLVIARRLPASLEHTDDAILATIHSGLAGLLLHELDEAWHVDGQRVRDPHTTHSLDAIPSRRSDYEALAAEATRLAGELATALAQLECTTDCMNAADKYGRDLRAGIQREAERLRTEAFDSDARWNTETLSNDVVRRLTALLTEPSAVVPAAPDCPRCRTRHAADVGCRGCPRCGSIDVRLAKEHSDHPGVEKCNACSAVFYDTEAKRRPAADVFTSPDGRRVSLPVDGDRYWAQRIAAGVPQCRVRCPEDASQCLLGEGHSIRHHESATYGWPVTSWKLTEGT